MIVLDVSYDPVTFEPSKYYLDGNRDRAMGILRFSHEYTVFLNRDLSFAHADSIDLGEAFDYGTEEEFEYSYPGVMAAIRAARDDGTLAVRRYRWDGVRNNPYIISYEEDENQW